MVALVWFIFYGNILLAVGSALLAARAIHGASIVGGIGAASLGA